MSDTKAVELLGEVLGALEGAGGPRPTWCGGAVVRVDLSTYDMLAGSGVRWATPRGEIPRDGEKVAARTVCGTDVTQMRGIAGSTILHGTCAECHGLEERFRIAARQLEGQSQGRR